MCLIAVFALVFALGAFGALRKIACRLDKDMARINKRLQALEESQTTGGEKV